MVRVNGDQFKAVFDVWLERTDRMRQHWGSFSAEFEDLGYGLLGARFLCPPDNKPGTPTYPPEPRIRTFILNGRGEIISEEVVQ